MSPAPLPADELIRLQQLRDYEVLDTPPEVALDDLARLAAFICKTPYALISLVDEKRQWFKSAVGLDIQQTGRDVAFCAYTILGSDLFVVEDASKDERFFDNPGVTGEMGIRFYAGAPLVSESGHSLGSLCVFDRVPRKLSAEQALAMEVLSRQVMTHLSMQRTMRRWRQAVNTKVQAQIAGEEADRRFQSVAQAAIDGIICADPHGNITFVNPAAERMLGYTAGDLTGHSLTQIMPERFREAHLKGFDRFQATGEARVIGKTVEVVGLRADGSEFPLELSLSTGKAESGPFFTGVLRDVTARKQVEAELLLARQALEARVIERTAELTGANLKLIESNEALAVDIHCRRMAEQGLIESEAKYRFLADAVSSIIWAANPQGDVDYYNQRWYTYTGLTFEETKGLGWGEVIHPDDLQLCITRTTDAYKSGEPCEVECRIRRADGTYRWHLARSLPRRDESGAIVQWVGSSTDVHDQIMNAASLEESRNELEARVEERTTQLQHENQFVEAVLDNIVDGIVACDASGKLVLLNRATRELHGHLLMPLPAEAWSEKYDLLCADGVTPMQERELPLNRAFNGEVIKGLEFVIAPQGMPRRQMIASGRSFRDSNGKRLGAVIAMHDITERTAADARFRVLFECSSDAHLLHDETGIIDCNTAALKMIGCRDKAQLLSLHPASLSPEFQPDGQRSMDKGVKLEATARREGHLRFDWMHQTLDGIPIPTEVTLTLVRVNGKDTILVVWHDLTERYKTVEALRLAKDSAESATRAKSEFLANMSHEIRTPMTAILGYADLLESPRRSDEERNNYIRVIRRNGEYLLQILNDILDLSKIEAGKLEVETVSCSPVNIISEVESLMRVRAIEKNITFDVEYAAHLPRRMASDPTRIRQILLNLVSNAIKFTANGQVKLRVSLEADAPNARVRFDVIDTGIGLTAEQQTRLFLPFGQADSSTTRRFGGTGLGLAICQRLALMLGGELSVTSDFGRGSTFSFSLLTGNAMEEDAADVEKGASDPLPVKSIVADRVGGRILLAEDGADNRRLVMIYLEEAGFVIDAVPDGRAAVEAIVATSKTAKAYDLVLMDMQMPVLDGYGATRELRRLGYTTLPIIALTAHAMAGEREKCLASGCDDFVTKPLDPVELIEKLQQRLSQNRDQR